MRPLLLLRLVTQVSVLLLYVGYTVECFVTIYIGNAGECFVTVYR